MPVCFGPEPQQGLATKLKTSISDGIGLNNESVEESITERHDVYGKNEIPTKKSPSFLELCWEASQDATLIMLFVSAA